MMQFNLLNHKVEYRKYFEQLNKAWLEEYFSVEPIDKWVLENPEQSILEVGGKILYAEYKGEIIATVGLQKVEEGVYEMIKMTVDKNYRRMGAGKFICLSAIKKAKDLKAQKLVLYSQTSLVPAITLYKQVGFKEVELETGKYHRADIKMELIF